MSSTRLLDIAIREFGAKGLEGASTRGIAAAAGTAMSAITYHYGGKEGLYLAAADRIAELMTALVGETLADLAVGEEDSGCARDSAIQVLLRMADAMANPEEAAWSQFVLREQMRPTAAFERIYAGGMDTLFTTLARLVEVASGAPPRLACIAAVTLIGQTIALRASRAMILKLLDVDQLAGDDLDDIKARIAANTHAILDRLGAEARNLS